MDKIIIRDLEVFYQVGVTAEERAQPQRLLLTLELDLDFKDAVSRDNLGDSIDYEAVSRRLLRFGDKCQYRLLETLATDIADLILEEFKPRAVTVEVKKFVIPQARHVAVRLTRPA